MEDKNYLSVQKKCQDNCLLVCNTKSEIISFPNGINFPWLLDKVNFTGRLPKLMFRFTEI